MLCGTGGSVERMRALAMRLELFLPRYWATWAGLSVLRAIELLPFAAQRHVGSALGRLIRRLPLAYVRIARRNIELCLPALSPQARDELVDRHCQSLGMGLCETANTWWSSDRRVHALAEVQGLEHFAGGARQGPRRHHDRRPFHHHRDRHPDTGHRGAAERGLPTDQERAAVAHHVHELLAPRQTDPATTTSAP